MIEVKNDIYIKYQGIDWLNGCGGDIFFLFYQCIFVNSLLSPIGKERALHLNKL